MSYNIVFGTRKTARAAGGYQKFEDAVVTIEASPEKGKNRRLLFNVSAMTMLGLEEGVAQKVMPAFLDCDENGDRKLFIANVSSAEIGETVSYSTSKNKAAYHDSKERGKAISSKALTTEIADFLELDGSVMAEYRLVPFAADESPVNLFEMINVNGKVPANQEVVAETIENKITEIESVDSISHDEVTPITVNDLDPVKTEFETQGGENMSFDEMVVNEDSSF